MSRKRSHSPSPTTLSSPSLEKSPEIFRSNPIEDRKSTFIAIYSPTLSAKTLQADLKFKDAMHRVVGWRKPSTQRTLNTSSLSQSVSTSTGRQVYVTGSDDDGEKYAGKKIEKVLNELDVIGTVVVARWYGGILLGPVRFTHIENVAREAILLWKRSLMKDGEDGEVEKEEEARKRRKLNDGPTEIVDEEKEKKRLIKLLSDRDQSIKVLRDLLAEKTTDDQKKKVEEGSQNTATSPLKTLDYSNMPLLRLKQLEKARDATIAFVLKQIDAAEVKSRTWTTDKSDNTEEGDG